ncbi:MAG: tetratricopeptide repeat protein [Caldilineaceae bacterium]|nr:tetratricopeptide repeat protein [Caldilineaceae bacterium]
MYLDRTYRPRRRRWSWLNLWPLYLLAVIAIILYEQQPAWLAPQEPTPTPIPTRPAIAFIADATRARAVGDYNVAMAAFEQAAILEPDNVEALMALSEIELMLDNAPSSLDYAQRAANVAPQNPRALVTLARAFNWNDDNESALSYALDALELLPEDATTLAVIGEIYTDEGLWTTAENYLMQALEKEPRNILALRNLAYFYELRRDYDEAIGYMEQAIDAAPLRFDFHIQLGRMYRVGKLNYEKANEAYAAAVRVYESPMTLTAQGDGLYFIGDHLQAVRVLRKAVEIDPDYGPALATLGMALYARRNYEDAAPNLEKGVRLLGDRARIEHLYTAGLAYINQEPRDCERAIPLLLKSLEIDQSARPALQGLATCGVSAPDVD